MSGRSLKIVPQCSGEKCQVAFLITDEEKCEACNFMEMLRRKYPADHKAMITIMKRLANYGEVRNTEKMKAVKGFPGVWEMKSRKAKAFRLYGFWSKVGIYIITHGSEKHNSQVRRNDEYKKTQRYKDRWEKEHP
jgi:putative component of toxin-antitoxin plasmid stabilization module